MDRGSWTFFSVVLIWIVLYGVSLLIAALRELAQESRGSGQGFSTRWKTTFPPFFVGVLPSVFGIHYGVPGLFIEYFIGLIFTRAMIFAMKKLIDGFPESSR